jgi:drug/metabolite transporter (DMT)-like permease
MSDLALYTLSVLIWGSTWLAIKFQLGAVPPAVSVAWRFALAALMLVGYARVKRLPLRFDARTHVWLVLQGVLLFGINYVLVYVAELSLTSGLVALIFSLVTFCNILGLRVFFSVPVKPTALSGAILGVIGIVLVFWPELANFSMSPERRIGVICALLGPLFASLGNMAATRSHRLGLPVVQANAWAMLYGSILVLVYAVIDGQPLLFDYSLPYIASLLYLALFGSVIAFVSYLTLLGRIGADRAGYTGVAIPIVALVLSTFFEDLRWDAAMAAGIALCVAGNVLVLRRSRDEARNATVNSGRPPRSA